MRASFQGFQTNFLDVLETKFDPSTHGLVDGTASESYSNGDTPLRNCVLLRQLSSPVKENETRIINLTNHLPFCPRPKRKNDEGLAHHDHSRLNKL